jgi:hypothetical protein
MLTALLLIAAAPYFDAIRFFSGCTRGEGQLKIVLHAHQRVSVTGVGKFEPDGTLVLDQIVTRGTTAPSRRQWRLRRTTPDRYTGTLSDARGAVAGETISNRLHLTFTSSDGSRIEQWLTLAADGRSAANVLIAKRLGVAIARLEEHIVKTACPME